MTINTQRNLSLGIAGDLLLTAVVTVSFLSIFSLPSGLLHLQDYALLAAAHLAYLLIGIYGWKFQKPARSLLSVSGYFALQIPLAAFIYYWSYGNAWLVLLPLASQSIELPRLWTLFVSLLLLLATVSPALFPERFLTTGLFLPEELAFPRFLVNLWEFAMALMFVLLFSELAARERQARAELDAAHRALGEYAVQAEDFATAQERNRLAREIHDSLGHHLTIINMQLEAARALMDNQPELARTALTQAQSLTRAGLAEVRQSVAALRASPLESRSLPEAITLLVDECSRSGISTQFRVNGAPCTLQPPAKLALFRTAQEGLTNIRKHARSTQARISLDYTGNTVRLTVWDNGAGAKDTGGGFGLIGLQERSRLLGGQVQIRTALGEGFTLQMEVPG